MQQQLGRLSEKEKERERRVCGERLDEMNEWSENEFSQDCCLDDVMIIMMLLMRSPLGGVPWLVEWRYVEALALLHL